MKNLFLFLILISNVYSQHWFNNSAFQKSLDKVTDSRAHTGNKVILLDTGIQSFKKRIENAKKADVIFTKTFEFWGDETGSALINELTDRAKNGAKVFIAFDVQGAFYLREGAHSGLKDGTLYPIPEYLERFLEESNGNGYVIPTSVPYSFLTSTPLMIPIDHEKYWITWRPDHPVKVIMGGMNNGDAYFLSGAKDAKGNPKKVAAYQSEGFSQKHALPMRDTDIEVTGSVTKDVIERYIQSCTFQLKNPNPHLESINDHIAKAIEEMHLIQKQMLQNASTAFPKDVGDAYVRFISKSARAFNIRSPLTISHFFYAMFMQTPSDSKIQFATPFFMPTKILWKGIYRAALRGVKFDILSNPTHGPEPGMMFVAQMGTAPLLHALKTMPTGSMNYYAWRAGAKNTSLLHQKVYSFGEKDLDPFCIGSSNFSSGSLLWNSEDVLVIQSPELKRKVNEMLREDFSERNAELITIQKLDQRSFLKKIKANFLDKIFRNFL